MIRMIKRAPAVQISQGSGISGQMVAEAVSTAGAVDESPSKAGMIKVKKISAQHLRSERLSSVNQRLRGIGRSAVASTSD
jgi:hypothetical protein